MSNIRTLKNSSLRLNEKTNLYNLNQRTSVEVLEVSEFMCGKCEDCGNFSECLVLGNGMDVCEQCLEECHSEDSDSEFVEEEI